MVTVGFAGKDVCQRVVAGYVVECFKARECMFWNGTIVLIACFVLLQVINLGEFNGARDGWARSLHGFVHAFFRRGLGSKSTSWDVD
jgi:hypothetical protein